MHLNYPELFWDGASFDSDSDFEIYLKFELVKGSKHYFPMSKASDQQNANQWI